MPWVQVRTRSCSRLIAYTIMQHFRIIIDQSMNDFAIITSTKITWAAMMARVCMKSSSKLVFIC